MQPQRRQGAVQPQREQVREPSRSRSRSRSGSLLSGNAVWRRRGGERLGGSAARQLGAAAQTELVVVLVLLAALRTSDHVWPPWGAVCEVERRSRRGRARNRAIIHDRFPMVKVPEVLRKSATSASRDEIGERRRVDPWAEARDRFLGVCGSVTHVGERAQQAMLAQCRPAGWE